MATFVCLPLSCLLSFNHNGFILPGLSPRQSLCTGVFFLAPSFPIPCLGKLFALSSLPFYGTWYLKICVLKLLLFCPCRTPITIWQHPSKCHFSHPSSLLVSDRELCLPCCSLQCIKCLVQYLVHHRFWINKWQMSLCFLSWDIVIPVGTPVFCVELESLPRAMGPEVPGGAITPQWYSAASF